MSPSLRLFDLEARTLPAASGGWAWRIGLQVLVLCWCALCAGTAFAQPVLVLQAGAAPVNAWPHVAMRSDPTMQLTVESMLQQPDTFAPPTTPSGSLGVRNDAVWLRIPLRTPEGATGPWAVNIDYALLHEVDVYLTRHGTVLQHAAMGNLQPVSGRSLLWRTPAMDLLLTPGADHELLIRLRTAGGMIAPVRIGDKHQLYPLALREQMLQGLFAGLAACLVVYSLAQWVTLRQRLFVYYAMLVMGSAGFSMQFFGVGGQFLWPNNLWMEQHIGSLLSFVAVTASFLFMGQVLSELQPGGRLPRVMHAGAALSVALGTAFALDILPTRAAMAVLSVLGPMPSIISVPAALRLARKGDSLGGTLLTAWAAYLIAAIALGLLVQGRLPANGWTMHAFQAGSAFDMLLFMRMLGLRTASLRLEALHASRERDAMRSLAHTDPLTDLPNRRGLDIALHAALPRSRPEGLLAVYVLDLDGFKPVNDQYGHDVGDRLLIAVTARLREHLRHADTVARIGGDEFVVMASELHDAEQAHELGNKLLDAFRTAFAVGPHEIRVGLTIGYALAPTDAREASVLIKLADAAMYSGKQSGRFCVRRNTGDLALSSI